MRVGILTPFDNRNFGNRLQNFALQEVLKRYADKVITIKNKPANPSLADRIRRGSFLAESITANKLLGDNRKVQFLQFNRRYLSITSARYWHNRGNPKLKSRDKCDLYCAGSDQIWNPQLGRASFFNYLGFSTGERTFSYAASFGIGEIPREYEADVCRGLQHIRWLSVREEAGKRLAENLTGRTDVQVLVDPTLLLSEEDWDAIAEKPKEPLPETYILTYFLGEIPTERAKAIGEKAEEMDCAIVELMDKSSPFYCIGPREFLYAIRHARLVCTDSFHGSVFSFLYRRPLAIFERAGEGWNMGSRLETFVSKFHLEACLAVQDEFPCIHLDPDYSAGYKALEEERRKAAAFLQMVFEERNRGEL